MISNSGFQVVHLFFPEFQVFSRLYHFKASFYHCKASPGVFNFSFFLSSFYYRSSSWRLYMMVHQGFNSFSKCSQDSVGRAQIFFFLHSKVRFVLPYHLRWCYVILDNLSSCFMIHMLSRMRYFKSINLFVGVILV